MDPTWLILLLPLAAGSGWYFGHRKVVQVVNHEASSLPSAYFRGLNFLLNEQHDKALDVLPDDILVVTISIRVTRINHKSKRYI